MNQLLDNLATRGQLKAEAFSQTEFDGLVSSAIRRLTDAGNTALADGPAEDPAER